VDYLLLERCIIFFPGDRLVATLFAAVALLLACGITLENAAFPLTHVAQWHSFPRRRSNNRVESGRRIAE
jgi:hypothetical protein